MPKPTLTHVRNDSDTLLACRAGVTGIYERATVRIFQP